MEKDEAVERRKVIERTWGDLDSYEQHMINSISIEQDSGEHGYWDDLEEALTDLNEIRKLTE